MAFIRTKVSAFTGKRAGVNFVDGKGETNDPYLINWFKTNGYTVDDGKMINNNVETVETVENVDNNVETVDNLKQDVDVEQEKPLLQTLKEMPFNDLRSLAKQKGLDLTNLKTKAQLIKGIYEADGNTFNEGDL